MDLGVSVGWIGAVSSTKSVSYRIYRPVELSMHIKGRMRSRENTWVIGRRSVAAFTEQMQKSMEDVKHLQSTKHMYTS